MMHFGIVIINMGIFFKEFSMEFFQLLNYNAGGPGDNTSLGIFDAWIAFNDFLWVLNPLDWFGIMGKWDKYAIAWS